MNMDSTFLTVFAAALLAGVAAKIVSMLLDALVWLRSVIGDITAEVACRRKGKHK